MERLIVFDLDGTLTCSKSELDSEMAELLRQLLVIRKVAVISGGAFPQFEKQFIKFLPIKAKLENLFLLPTSGSSFYKFEQGKWACVFRDELTHTQRGLIRMAIGAGLRDIKFEQPDEVYGEQIEDRKTQVTFSALGQNAPVELKEKWDVDGSKRLAIRNAVAKYLKFFEVRVGGKTSVDITKRGIDKGYGVKQLEKQLQIPISEMVFVGDALQEGGNDYPVKAAGVKCISVSGVEDCKTLIKSWLTES